jgi:hypothetical protein
MLPTSAASLAMLFTSCQCTPHDLAAMASSLAQALCSVRQRRWGCPSQLSSGPWSTQHSSAAPVVATAPGAQRQLEAGVRAAPPPPVPSRVRVQVQGLLPSSWLPLPRWIPLSWLRLSMPNQMTLRSWRWVASSVWYTQQVAQQGIERAKPSPIAILYSGLVNLTLNIAIPTSLQSLSCLQTCCFTCLHTHLPSGYNCMAH